MYEAEKKARHYERVFGERILKPLQPALLNLIERPERIRVALDCEAGTGLLTRALLKMLPGSARVLVSEEDRGCLRLLHHKNDIKDDKRCFIKQASAHDLGLANGVVDLAVSHVRLQQVPHLEQAISELHRVLSPHGQLILSFIQPATRGSLIDQLKKKKADDIVMAMQSSGVTLNHARQLLHKHKIFQMHTKNVQLDVIIGQSTPPHLDSLWTDFLLPMFYPKCIDLPPVDLDDKPLLWKCEVSIIHAVVS